ncbi:MAG: FAD-dependent oxidoreductase [Sphaerochaetaceae bacterium]|nr:FAD-dependent oxidoreductase [Sphaerochaetaceae bacterium]
MKVVIVGGVAGGATAAARIRRLDEKAEITVFEKSGFVSYANCGLPYYIGEVITDPSELTLQSPGSFRKRFRVDVKVRHEVTGIDRQRKCVSVKNLDSGEVFEEKYDKLILSPGARPVKPALSGVDSPLIFTLRTVEDTFRIYDFVEEKKPSRAVIVGGGYIGIETAENLRERGMEVSIVQRPAQLMNTLDYDMATFVHAKLRSRGIRVMTSSDVTGFETSGDKITVSIRDKESLCADMVILAIGVQPDSALAEKAGLELGIKKSIVVNEKMQSSDPDIYAVGDAVQIKNFVSDLDALISLAGPANKQGRIAADNICGLSSAFRGSAGSSVIKIFDMTVASTGLTEKACKAAGIKCDYVILSPSSHASYYPGARTMTLKVVFSTENFRILGAQGIGAEGVDKRIDVFATAIMAGMTAGDLKDLDLCYAPPYSSAKDPVNMAGFMIENIQRGLVKQYHIEDVERLVKTEGVFLLDTRTEGEYGKGHVEGYVNIPVDELRERLGEIDRDKPVYVMCQSGLRSYISCRILMQEGFDCYNFSGGYRFYSAVTSEAAVKDRSLPCGMDK